MQKIDLTGQSFGKLTALKLATHNGRSAWICRCQCGAEKPVAQSSLRSGASLSCGCGAIRWGNQSARKHGLWRHPLRGTWRSMKERCYNPKAFNYPRYGGRGITVCDHWRDSFELFVKDNQASALPGLTLDRIDPNGDYTPENCRWISKKGQARNTRSTKYYLLNGVNRSIHEWADLAGIKPCHITYRLNKGWPLEPALTLPVERHTGKAQRY